MLNMPRKIPIETKQLMRELYEGGLNVLEISRRVGHPYSNVYNYTQQRRRRPYRSRRQSMDNAEPPFEGRIRVPGPNYPENWRPTFPIETNEEALRYALHFVQQAGLGRAVVNQPVDDFIYCINPATRVVHDEKEATFSFELVFLPSLKVGRFTVTSDGFVSRVWREEKTD